MKVGENKRMLFVVGNSRSGTTMLGRMLGKHSRVYKFPELHLFGPCVPHGREEQKLSREQLQEIFTWLLDVAERKFHAERDPQRYSAEARELVEIHFREGMDAWDAYHDFVFYETNKHGKEIPSEDLPGNVFRLGQIIRKFPQSRIIHIVRDPRDVLLSQKNRRQRRKMGAHYVNRRESLRFWANYHPLFISRLWHNAVRAGLRIKSPQIITIRFEELIASPAETLKKICSHAGIEFEESMLLIPQVGSSSRKDDPGKLGIDPARSGAWNKGGLDDAEIEICESVNGDLMKELGYTPSGRKGSSAGRIRMKALLPLKGVMALALNWNRNRGILNYLLRRFRKA